MLTIDMQLLKDINESENIGSGIEHPVQMNGILYFSANDGSAGHELWKSDGTADGTVMVKGIRPDRLPSDGQTLIGWGPRFLTNVNGTLFFTASDGTNGRELWTSDGAESDTRMVKDINSSGNATDVSLTLPVRYLTAVNGTVFFAANDGSTGYELWRSDGTETGTVPVKDIRPGAVGSSPANLTNVDDRLFFSANDGIHGNELWQSDGTETGTMLAADIMTGSYSSDPIRFLATDHRLFVVAFTGEFGQEIWTGLLNGPTVNGDFTGDGLVDLSDRDAWLAEAGAINLPSGNPYLLGDANLDGVVNGQDFIIWNSNRFSQIAAWSRADFNSDGIVDGQDFVIWNNNKFNSAVSRPPRGLDAIRSMRHTPSAIDRVFVDESWALPWSSSHHRDDESWHFF